MAINPILLMAEISKRLTIAFKEISDLCTAVNCGFIDLTPRLHPHPINLERQYSLNEQKESRDSRSSPEVKEIKQPKPIKQILDIKQARQKKGPPVQKKQEAPKLTTLSPPALQKSAKKSDQGQPQPKRGRGAAKRQKKAEKDPDLPRKPAGSYILFQQCRKPQILEQNPNLSLPQLSKILGREWQNLSPAAKSPYQNQYIQAKKKYEKDMQNYMKTHPDYEQPRRKKKVVEEEVEEEQVSQSPEDLVRINEQGSIQIEDSLGQDL